MARKTGNRPTTLLDVANAVGVYPEAAFHFVRDGLEYSARETHGPMTPPQFLVAQYMSNESIDLVEVMERMENGSLDPMVAAAVKQAGGSESLNRNVSGEELCWAFREYARRRWGLLAKLVLGRWNIKTTEDFGRIVFALVDHEFMQKESHDTMADFVAVYDFDHAFRKSFQIGDSSD